jgi:hypothetical protein
MKLKKSLLGIDYVVSGPPVYEKYDVQVYKYLNRHGLRQLPSWKKTNPTGLALSYLYVTNDTVFTELAGINEDLVDSILKRSRKAGVNSFLYDSVLGKYKKAILKQYEKSLGEHE